MPFHFCVDELMMIMAMLPFIGVFFQKIHAWYHTKFGHKCHEERCDDKHVDHPMGHYVIRMNADKTEMGLMPADADDARALDSDGKYMPIVESFEAPSWEEAKFKYEKFLDEKYLGENENL